MIRKIALTVALAALLGWGIWALAGSNTGQSRGAGLRVTASYYPLFEFTKHVGGDKVQVTNITPAGAEPHDFEPSAKALAEAGKSSLFVYNGGSLESWTEKFLRGYHGTSVKGSQGIPLKAGHPEEGDGRSAQLTDPHFWLDPVLAQQVVRNIRDGLSKVDPANKALYSKNAAAYIAQLAALDHEFAAGLAQCKLRTVVVSHQSMGYLATRYSLSVEAVAGVSPDSEPSAARLAEIAQLVRRDDIHYIFFESLVSPRLADTIAKETGAQTLVLDPIEGLTYEAQKAGKNYLSVQRDNLKNLRAALACQ